MPGTGFAQTLLLGALDAAGLLTAGVTVGTSIPIDRTAYPLLTIFLRGFGTVSGGTILIEEADWMPTELPYTGTWSVLSTVTASGLTGGAQQAYHYPVSAYAYVRVRVSSAITGGGTVAAILRSAGN